MEKLTVGRNIRASVENIYRMLNNNKSLSEQHYDRATVAAGLALPAFLIWPPLGIGFTAECIHQLVLRQLLL